MKQILSLFHYYKKYKLWTFLGTFLILFEVLMDLLFPTIMANIVSIGIANNDMQYILYNIVFLIILLIVGVTSGIFSAYFTAKATESVGSDLRSFVYKKVFHLQKKDMDPLSVGHMVTIFTDDISQVTSTYFLLLRILLRVPIILIGSIIMTIILNPELSLLLVVLLPIMIMILYFVMKKAFPYFDFTQKCTDDMNRYVRENISGIREVKAYVKEKDSIFQFRKINQRLMKFNVRGMQWIALAMPILMCLINFTTICILWIGGREVILGHTEIGNIMAYIQYLTNILSAIMMGSIMILMLSKSKVSIDRIDEILNKKEDPKEKELGHKMKGEIVFDHVSFSYKEGSGDAVLKNISFSVPKGTWLGIVGPTGAGKSTLFSLLHRFYDVKQGQIFIDGHNIDTFSKEELRKQIGLCLQEPYLFSGTIKNNICGKEKVNIKKLKKIAKMACLDFVHNRYDTEVEQNGNNFSGGQKQRIMLAKTLYQEPQILLLDDATSALDYKTERTFYEHLRKNYQDRTVIVITSRIMPLQYMDQILVLEDGKIKGIGTHKELMKEPTYQAIYTSQMEEKRSWKK